MCLKAKQISICVTLRVEDAPFFTIDKPVLVYGLIGRSEQRRGVSEEFASEDSLVAKLLFDSENLVILGEPVGPAGSARLNLSGAKTADEVTDEVVLSLTRPVGDHDAPAGALGHVGSLDGLSDGANLVDLKEKSVAELLVNTSLHTLGVRHKQVVTHNLHAIADLLRHLNV